MPVKAISECKHLHTFIDSSGIETCLNPKCKHKRDLSQKAKDFRSAYNVVEPGNAWDNMVNILEG